MNAPLATMPNSGIPFGARRDKAADAKLKAAGMMIWTTKGTALFLKRSSKGDHQGEWAFPGGKIEAGETPLQGAIREVREETGWIPEGHIVQIADRVNARSGTQFTTFAVQIGNEFVPDMDDGEHTSWYWAPLTSPPEPLHPGVQVVLDDLAEKRRQAKDAFRESDHNRAPDGKFSSGGGSAGSAETDTSEEGYVNQAMANLKATSRTASGKVDLSSSPDKHKSMAAGLTGEGAKEAATRNFKAVITDLYGRAKKNDLPKTGPEMGKFIDDVAAKINTGILRPGQVLRTHETNLKHQTPVARLASAHREFSAELAKRLQDPDADPIETAAFIEWKGNLVDHFWADGVGKTTKALATIPLIRAGLPLPSYPDNKTFFSHSLDNGGSWEQFNKFYHGLVQGQAHSGAHDEFRETDHPRDKSGQFTSGASGSASAEGKSSKRKEPKPPTREKQYSGIDGVSMFMDMTAKMLKNHLPKGMESQPGFILKNGLPFTANEKTFDHAKIGKPHECFKNAALEALRDPELTYVEGYVSVKGAPLEHAWTVDKSGQIYDHTITADMAEGIDGYFGVPFSKNYLVEALRTNEVFGLFGHEAGTSAALLKGEVGDYREKIDVDALSDDVVTDRLAYAARRLRSIEPTDTIDTPERNQLRQRIVDDLYNKDIDKRARNRQSTIILGLPGAGKSTFANPLLDGGALEVDPDLVKALLPEYGRGEGASAVHEESSALTKVILRKAIDNGDDFVWPRVDSPDKIVRDIKMLKEKGYDVHVKFIDVSVDLSSQSCIRRFLAEGRYVDPLAISQFGDTPRESYDAAVKTGMLSTQEAYSRVAGRNGFEKLAA